MKVVGEKLPTPPFQVGDIVCWNTHRDWQYAILKLYFVNNEYEADAQIIKHPRFTTGGACKSTPNIVGEVIHRKCYLFSKI
jgi:hypothetical protein